jgi:proteic killer suppression protein
VIQAFRDQATEDVWNNVDSAKSRTFSATVITAAQRKLDMLHAAKSVDDMRAPPGNRLELLKGNLAGFHSVRVNDQYRIIFRWADTGPTDVQLTDYH